MLDHGSHNSSCVFCRRGRPCLVNVDHRVKSRKYENESPSKHEENSLKSIQENLDYISRLEGNVLKAEKKQASIHQKKKSLFDFDIHNKNCQYPLPRVAFSLSEIKRWNSN
jgi:hypothetical protein